MYSICCVYSTDVFFSFKRESRKWTAVVFNFRKVRRLENISSFFYPAVVRSEESCSNLNSTVKLYFTQISRTRV